MTRLRRNAQLRDQVERVSTCSRPRREVAVKREYLLARARSVTTQTGFELKCRGAHNTGAVGRADPDCAKLGTTNRGQGKSRGLV